MEHNMNKLLMCVITGLLGLGLQAAVMPEVMLDVNGVKQQVREPLNPAYDPLLGRQSYPTTKPQRRSSF